MTCVCYVDVMRVPCVCHAYAMRMPCACHAYAIRIPCVCHAYANLFHCHIRHFVCNKCSHILTFCVNFLWTVVGPYRCPVFFSWLLVQEHLGWTWNKIAESWFIQEWYMDISPDEFRRGPKNPPCAFFLIQDGRHHVGPNAILEKTGVCHNSSLLQLEKNT